MPGSCQPLLDFCRQSPGLDVCRGKEYWLNGRPFPTVFAAKRRGHPIVLQFTLQALAPLRIMCVVTDERKVFVLPHIPENQISLSIAFSISLVLFFKALTTGCSGPISFRKTAYASS